MFRSCFGHLHSAPVTHHRSPLLRAWLHSDFRFQVSGFILPLMLLLGAVGASAQTTNIISGSYGPATIGSGTTSLITNGASFAGIITDNGWLLFQQSGLTITDSYAITGSGSLTMNGTGTTTLSGTNTYTGGTIINGGTLILNASGINATTTMANNGSSTITVNNGGTLYFNVGNVFGYHTTTVLTPIVVNAGGTLTGVSGGGGGNFNILGPLYLNGGTFISTSVSSFSGFGLKGDVTVNGGTNTSTISGTGFTLGSAAVTGVTFNVASGGTPSGVDLLVSANMYNGAAPAWDPNTQASYLTKTGAGVMKLTGTGNTYSGITTVSGGTLLAGANGSLSPNSALYLTNGGTLVIGSTLQTIPGFYIENSTLTQTNGSLTVNGNFRLGDVAGSTAVYSMSGGTLTLSPSADELFGASGSATVTQTGGSVIGGTWMTIGRYTGGTGNYSISGGTLSNTNTGTRLNVGEQGNGTLTISGSGSVSASGGMGISWNGGNGTVYLNGGNLSVASIAVGSAGGTSAFYFNGGSLNALAATTSFMSGLTTATIQSGGAFINNNGYAITIGQNLNGSGGLTLNGSGSAYTTLTGSNSFTGPVTVNGTGLQFTNDSSFGAVPVSPTNDIILNGGQLVNNVTSPTISSNRNITLTASNGFMAPGWSGFTVNGQISGPGGLGIAWDGGTLILNGSNSYSGTTTIGTYGLAYWNSTSANPTLQLGNANALPYGNAVAFGTSANNNTAKLDLGGFSPFLSSLTGGGNATVTTTTGSPTLTVGVSNASSTYGGVMTGGFSLAKTGTGTFTITDYQNYYLNNLIINAGTVQATGGDNILYSVTNDIINSGGTLLGSSNNSTHLLNVVLNGGTLTSPGTLVGGSSAVIWGTFDLDKGVSTLGSSNTSVISAVNVALTQSGGTIFNVTNGATNGIDLLVSGTFTEPSSIAPYTTALIKQGNGVMQLAGTNSYTNATTVSGGTLLVTGLLGSGSYAAAITDNGSLIFSNTANQTLSGVISGSGTFTQSGSATTTLSGANTFSGSTFVNAGRLVFGNSQYSGGAGSGSITINNGGTLYFNSDNTFGNADTGSNSLVTITVNSGGQIQNGGTFNYLKTIILNGGQLIANGGGAGGWNAYELYNVTVGGTNASVISANTSVNGNNMILLSRSGTTTFAVADATGDTNADLFVSASLLDGNGVVGSLTKTGLGTMLLSGSNSFTGTTRISAGSLVLSNANALAGSTLDLNTNDSGTLTLGLASAATYNFGGLQGGRSYSMGSNSFSFGANNSSTTYSGALSGSGAFTKVGSGNTFLSGSNSFSGTTYINSGYLNLANTNGPALYNSGSGTVVINGTTATSSWLYTGATNQLGTNVDLVLTNNGSNYAVFVLYGKNQTIGNLLMGGTASYNVIENTQSETGIGNSTLTITQTTNATYSGIIKDNNGGSGTVSLVKNGAATLTFTGANITYTGGTIVNAGTLILNDSQVNGTGTIRGSLTVNTNATVILTNGSAALGYSTGAQVTNLVINQGSVIAAVAQHLFMQSGQPSGNVTLNGGLMQVNGGVSSTNGSQFEWGNFNVNVLSNAITSVISGRINIRQDSSANLAFTVAQGATNGTDLLVSAAITESAASGISKAGAGVMQMSGTNTYTGTTTVSAGTLLVTGLLNSGSYAGNITDNAWLIYSNSAAQTLSGVISGTGSLTKRGASTLTLSGANTYTGGTFIDAGMLTLSGGSSTNGSFTIENGATLQGTAAQLWFYGTPSFTFTTNGGGTIDTFSGVNFIMGGNATYTTLGGAQDLIKGSSGINLNSTTATFNVARGTDPTADLLISSYLWNSGNIVKTGAGILRLTGTNTYTGTTTIGQGTILAGAVNTLSTNSSVTFSNVAGATLDLANFNQTIGALSGGGSTGGNVSLGTATLTVGNNNGSGTFSGLITGTGGLVKTGTGVQGLSGSNNFANGVRVNAGTLGLGNNNALGTGTLTMASNNAILLALTNGLVITNSIVLNGNEYFDSGTYTTTYNGVISGSGAAYILGSGTNVFGTNNTYTGGTFLNSGTLAFGLPGAIGTGTLTFQSNAAVAATTGMTITNRVVINSNATATFNYGTNTITNSGAISGAGNFLKLGNGNLSLTASNTFTGIFQVNAGTIDFGTSGSISPSSIYLGYNTGDSGIMKVGTGNTVTVNNNSPGLVMGYNGSGALYQSGGAINLNGGSGGIAFPLGYNPGSYGFYQLSGGTASIPELGVGSGPGGNGIFQMTGGTFNSSFFFGVARADTTTNQLGEFDMLGGTFNALNFSSDLGFGTSSGKSAVVNFLGGTSTISNGLQLSSSGGTASSNLSVVNFNGGNVNVPYVFGAAGVATNYVNFGGGTITATSATNNFISTVNRVTIFSGGATINNGANAITITNNLTAPTGNGITNISFTGGSGYIGSPFVRITGGGGSGAAAMAQVDPTTGTVTNIVITSPGFGYTSAPTITLYQGGGSNAIATASIGAVSSGGLTLNGSGSAYITLTGSNSFTGPVTVNGTGLQFTNDSSFGAVPASPTNDIILNGGQLVNNVTSPTISSNRNITLTASNGFMAPGWGGFTVAGQISGPGGLGIAWDGGTLILNGSNSYSGTTTIGTYGLTYWNSTSANPTLQLGNSNALPYGNAVAFGTSANNNTAKLDLGGFSPFLTSLTGGGNATVTTTTGTPTLTIGLSNASSTFGGIIQNGSGTIALVKTGTGTQTLSGINTYTGLTTVNGGTLVLNAGNFNVGIITGGAVVNNGGTLQVAGAGSSGIYPTGNTTVVTVNGGGSLIFTGNANAAPYVGTITLSNSGGLLPTVSSPDGTAVRFGYSANGNVNSYGISTNTFGNAINLINSSSGANPFTVTAGASNTLLISGIISDYPGYTGTPVIFSGSGTTILSKTNTYSGTTTVSSNSTLLVTGLLGNGSYAANITENGSLIFSNSANQTLSGTLSGSGTFTQAGSGTTTLNFDNIYSGFNGFTVVSAGVLAVNGSTSGGKSWSGAGISNGSTMIFTPSNNDALFIAQTLSGSGNWIINAASYGSDIYGNRVDFTGSNSTSSGTFTVTNYGSMWIENNQLAIGSNSSVNLAGTNTRLQFYNSSATIAGLTGNGTVDIQNGTGTLSIGAGDVSSLFSGVIRNSAGTLHLAKIGTGAFTLSGANTYSGVTTIGQGTLLAGTNNTLSTNSSVTFSNVAGATLDLANFNQTIVALNGGGSTGGTVSLGTATLTVGNNNGSGTFSGLITGAGGLVKTGTGVQGLSSSNNFSGGVRVNAGTLGLGNNNALGTGTLTMVSNSATLLAISNNVVITNSIVLNGNEYFDSGTYIITYNGVISGGFSPYILGSGTVVFGTNNTYTGGTYLNAGTLAFGTPGAIGSGTLTFQSNAAVAATTSMTITNRVVINSGATATFNYGTNAITNSGAISGAGNFLKLGNGNLSLTASNTFTGTLQVNAGTIDFGTSGSITPSAIYLGYNAGDAGIMKVGTGNTFNVNNTNGPGVVIGYNGSGALYQSGGTLMVATNGAQAFPLGYGPGSYGFYQLSGGTASVPEIGAGSGGPYPQTAGNGIFQMIGGSFTSSGFFGVARADSTTNQLGEFDMLGGTFTGYIGGNVGFAANSGKSALMNFLGGTVNASGLSLSASVGTPSNNLSVVNFNGGTVNTPYISAATTTGTNYINFGGGTITATAATNNFISGVTRVTIFSGGATINNNSNNITITNNLTAPTGNGITNILISAAGSGYIGSPFVRITGGGGSGAAAMAQVDPTTGNVTNIVITSPGWGYTSAPTITLYQGGGSNATATASIGAVSGGGLTKTGIGYLELTGSNSFTGPLTIKQDTVRALSDAALGAIPASPTNAIIIDGGELMNDDSNVNVNSNRNIYVTTNGGYFDGGWSKQLVINGTISGPGNIGIAFDSGTVIFAGSNSYSGILTIGTTNNYYYAANMTFKVGSSNTVPYASGIAFGTNSSGSTATLDLNGISINLGVLSGGANAYVTSSSAGSPTVTVGVSNTSSTFGGVIQNGSGTVALVKTGTGTRLFRGSTPTPVGRSSMPARWCSMTPPPMATQSFAAP